MLKIHIFQTGFALLHCSTDEIEKLEKLFVEHQFRDWLSLRDTLQIKGSIYLLKSVLTLSDCDSLWVVNKWNCSGGGKYREATNPGKLKG